MAGVAGTSGRLGISRGTGILGLIYLPVVTAILLVLHFLFLGWSSAGAGSASVGNFLSKTSGLASGSFSGWPKFSPRSCSPPSDELC